MWLIAVRHALACGGRFSVADLERQSTVRFGDSEMSERPFDQPRKEWTRIGGRVETDVEGYEVDDQTLLAAHARYDLALEGGLVRNEGSTLLVRDGAPVAEWLDSDDLALGGGLWHFEFGPGREPRMIVVEGAEDYPLRVLHDGVLALEGMVRTTCGFPQVPDDVRREVRTRIAYWLTVSREPAPLVPTVRRVGGYLRKDPRASPPPPAPSGPPIPYEVVASSALTEGTRRYGPEALADGDAATAWCEGGADLGIGERLTVVLPTPTDPIVTLLPGYRKDAGRLTDNAQPRRVLVTTDTHVAVELTLPYTSDPATPPVQLPLDAPGATSFTLELVEGWRGERWSDLCISELSVAGR